MKLRKITSRKIFGNNEMILRWMVHNKYVVIDNHIAQSNAIRALRSLLAAAIIAMVAWIITLIAMIALVDAPWIVPTLNIISVYISLIAILFALIGLSRAKESLTALMGTHPGRKFDQAKKAIYSAAILEIIALIFVLLPFYVKGSLGFGEVFAMLASFVTMFGTLIAYELTKEAINEVLRRNKPRAHRM